jgi:two-component system, NtrC family, sensor histidine kinase HydH
VPQPGGVADVRKHGQRRSASRATQPGSFSLARWFTTVGLASIALLAIVGALLLSRLFEQRMLLQEGRLTAQFVQGVIDVEGAASYFERPQPDRSNYMEQLLAHIARSPDVLRTNLYSRDRVIIWSSDASMSGRSFAGQANPELDAALAGNLEIHEEGAEESAEAKAEHSNLRSADGDFIELYVPVWDAGRGAVVGAVELYRDPRLLRESIASGKRLVWAGAIGAAAVLFFALLPLVRRADAMIRVQQQRIVETETLAAMGDLGSAVAHGIRNPLAVIRTSAEIMKEGKGETGREAASEIMDQVDRVEHWVRELLTYVHLPAGEQQLVELGDILRSCLQQFASELRRRAIEESVDIGSGLPPVRGDAMLIAQVFRSLVSNAVEAMPRGGRLVVAATAQPAEQVTVEIRDTGIGMDEEQLARAMKPFHTTKSQGLGVGLPLARRIVERMGGRIALSSRLGEGVTVRLTLPAARS